MPRFLRKTLTNFDLNFNPFIPNESYCTKRVLNDYNLSASQHIHATLNTLFFKHAALNFLCILKFSIMLWSRRRGIHQVKKAPVLDGNESVRVHACVWMCVSARHAHLCWVSGFTCRDVKNSRGSLFHRNTHGSVFACVCQCLCSQFQLALGFHLLSGWH